MNSWALFSLEFRMRLVVRRSFSTMSYMACSSTFDIDYFPFCLFFVRGARSRGDRASIFCVDVSPRADGSSWNVFSHSLKLSRLSGCSVCRVS